MPKIARPTLSLTFATAVLSVLSLFSFFAPPTAHAAPRDIQIVEVDFENQIIELFNFGTTTEDLDGWRFCSHDATSFRRYSSPSALNGLSIAPGASLRIHMLSDSGGSPGTIDRPAGNFAEPFDEAAHGLQLFFAPVNFGVGATIADHVQWSVGGADNASAAERSDEAEDGGVWTDQTTWVATEVDSTSIMLVESANGLVLHGPDDYEAVPEPGLARALAVGSFILGATHRRRPRATSRHA